MNKLKFLTIVLLLSNLFLLSSCGDDDTDTPEIMNIVETASSSPELSSLVDALGQAGLVNTLQGTSPFTVFAPTNQAFQELLDSNPAWNSLSDIDQTVLANILKFHVLAAEIKSSELADSYVTTLSTGPNDEQIVLQIDVTGGVVFNAIAKPVDTDIEATNGVVHLIDKVMLPPTVVDIALNSSNFSSLVAALTRSDLNTDYVSILSGEGPFTVFAPTNQAFQELLDSNSEWNTLGDIPVATLEAVLNYHVVSGANVQSDELENDQKIATLGGELTIDLTEGAKVWTTSGQSVDIIITDVQGTNGVVHAVESVLLP